MMSYLGLSLLFGLLIGGLAQRPNSKFLNLDVPELPTGFFDDVLPFLGCLDGNCNVSALPTSQTSTPVNHAPTKATAPAKTKRVVSSTPAPASPIPAPPNSHCSFSTEELMCKVFLKQMNELDVKFPHLKALKSQLLSYLGVSKSSYEGNPLQRKEIALDVVSSFIKLLLQFKERILSCPAPVPVVSVQPIEEIIAEVEHPHYVGSVRGIPGIHYPNYSEVPITSFSCSDKKYIPGFYADVETRCQVFHVCYQHRRESFLCPIGTVFNQPILACDYWYSSNCSLSPLYFDVNEEKPDPVHIPEKSKNEIEQLITTIIEHDKPAFPNMLVKGKDISAELDDVFKFLPIKAKVTEFIEPKIVKASVVPAAKVAAKTKLVKAKVADAIVTKVASKALPLVKAKVASKVVPVVKVKAAAAAVPIIAAKTVAVPVAKVAAAASVPLVKSKVLSAAAMKLPIVKSAVGMDAKLLATAKAKKSVMISPLTKKALALGYLKLLKAKKLAMMG